MKKLQNSEQKNSKSVGSFYLEQAAKMCPFRVSVRERLIYIPHSQLETDDLVVAHLRNLGFLIQSEIPTEPPAPLPYNPSLNLTHKMVAHARGEFLLQDRFRVVSTECELEITHLTSKKVQLTYTNRPNKHALLISEEQLKKSLSFGSWIRI